MGSDTHKQDGEGGRCITSFRIRIEPLHVAFQALHGVVTTQPTSYPSLSLSMLPHTGHLLILSAMVLSLLSGLVQAIPHTLTCLAHAYHSVSALCLRDAFLNPQNLYSKDLGGIFW